MNNYINKSLTPWKTTPWLESSMEALFNSPENGTIIRLTFARGIATMKTGIKPGRLPTEAPCRQKKN